MVLAAFRPLLPATYESPSLTLAVLDPASKRQTYPWGLPPVLMVVPTPDTGFRDAVALKLRAQQSVSIRWKTLPSRQTGPDVHTRARRRPALHPQLRHRFAE